MFIRGWGKVLLPIAILALQVFAVEPAPADKTKWDEVCKKKAGPQYTMVFNADGKPSGRCEAPPVWSCYWGPYTDPKTGAKGCCGKGHGTFSIDAVVKTEGACCVAPAVYSFDAKGGKGACCDPPSSYHVDIPTGSGKCCANQDDTYSCECSCKENPNPSCPKWHGREYLFGGKKWKLYCNLINHGENDLGYAPAASWADCITRCAGMSNCVRAIYMPANGVCYLRTHGNKPVPVTPDPYLSAHLIEDTPPPPVVNPTPPPPPLVTTKCPAADGKVVTIGGVEYKIYCTLGHKDSNPNLGISSAKDIKQCMEQCSSAAKPACQGVNFYDDGNPDDNCVWASIHEFPPTGAAPAGGDFLAAIPTTKRP